MITSAEDKGEKVEPGTFLPRNRLAEVRQTSICAPYSIIRGLAPRSTSGCAQAHCNFDSALANAALSCLGSLESLSLARNRVLLVYDSCVADSNDDEVY